MRVLQKAHGEFVLRASCLNFESFLPKPNLYCNPMPVNLWVWLCRCVSCDVRTVTYCAEWVLLYRVGGAVPALQVHAPAMGVRLVGQKLLLVLCGHCARWMLTEPCSLRKPASTTTECAAPRGHRNVPVIAVGCLDSILCWGREMGTDKARKSVINSSYILCRSKQDVVTECEKRLG